MITLENEEIETFFVQNETQVLSCREENLPDLPSFEEMGLDMVKFLNAEEKKPKEKEKDMRGTYTAINLVKNKLRSQGCKNPIVMLSDVGGDKKVSEERTAGYPGGPANMGKPSKKPGDNVKGPVEKDPEDKVKGPAKQKAKNKKNGSGRYNPFKDGRTPTSASETTGP